MDFSFKKKKIAIKFLIDTIGYDFKIIHLFSKS